MKVVKSFFILTAIGITAVCGAVQDANTQDDIAMVSYQTFVKSYPLHAAVYECDKQKVIDAISIYEESLNCGNLCCSPSKRKIEGKVKEFVNKGIAREYIVHEKELLTQVEEAPLHWAAYYDTEGVTTGYLISNGAEVDAKNIQGATPLLAAASASNQAVVKILLKAGADHEMTDIHNSTALLIAAFKGEIGIVGALLENGAEVDPEHKLNITPLCYAAMQNHAEVVRALIEADAQVDHQVKHDQFGGFTPLHLAAYMGAKEAVVVLLEHGACVDMADDKNGKPLGYALLGNHKDVIRILRAAVQAEKDKLPVLVHNPMPKHDNKENAPISDEHRELMNWANGKKSTFLPLPPIN